MSGDAQRARMVSDQIAARGVRDLRVLDAMSSLPRDLFVPQALAGQAYADCALPIGAGQTISQPYIVALMAEAAAVGRQDRVLEVGAGSGYAAAVLGRLAARVWAVERVPALARAAAERLVALGMDNVEIVAGDGTVGLPEHAPFDAILAAAGGPAVPEALEAQLAEGGRLVMPVGDRASQMLVKVTRRGEAYAREELGEVRFVPLIGEQGWTR